MTRNRYAVPMEQLDSVHVEHSRLETVQAQGVHPDSAAWTFATVPPFGDGMGGDADGE
jgi:hypothetical protein